ncbi:hypothetical protein DPMN_135807 [Dreissena polymorpha]|uniref:C1q domain-containing protein n=2 Tax=Dreissena polymorpha TaxID=45954 RepID=A0A9D4G4M1_DREPO|nr:hypothetical protein DPMN_135807 [Dreissena polymorpha]
MIYFYARTPASSSLSLSKTVIYTHVEVNDGQGYSSTNGRFTVSVPGLYAFTVQYCLNSGDQALLEIVDQKKTLQRAAFGDRGNNDPCVSMHVFTKDDVSDQMWVQTSWTAQSVI